MDLWSATDLTFLFLSQSCHCYTVQTRWMANCVSTHIHTRREAYIVIKKSQPPMATVYAYLKPSEGDSPFYVHLTLDSGTQTLRLYWHMAWWKNEVVDMALFDRWRATFKALGPRLSRCKEKERRHSYHVAGRGRVSSGLLHDIMGFVEPDTLPELPCKLAGYVNTQNHIIEVEVHVPYSCLGALPEEWSKLKHVFTANPDYETVRAKLTFFQPAHVLGVSKRRPASNSSSSNGGGSTPVVPSGSTTAKEEEVVAEIDEIRPDSTLDTSTGHPYALPLTKDKQD